MRVRWLRTALRNLDEEANFISADDPQAARAAARRVLDAIALLASQPALGRPGRVPGTRELIVPQTRYVIPYRGRADIIEILRIFHASRRPPQRW
jgi:toxin ParE1/3/4